MQARTTAFRTTAALIGAVFGGAQRVWACPVCFGALEGPVADGTNKAILALLGITAGVLMCFAGFFIYLYKRARAMPLEPAGAPAARDTTAGPVEANIMEGAA